MNKKILSFDQLCINVWLFFYKCIYFIYLERTRITNIRPSLAIKGKGENTLHVRPTIFNVEQINIKAEI